MSKNGLTSLEKIKELEIDEVFARAFLENERFCRLVRSELSIGGSGCATSVKLQEPHKPDTGTIDLYVELDPVKLLIENKISATWSHAKWVAQPERYARSAEALGARTLLIAPLLYIAKTSEARDFDFCLDYEMLARSLQGEDRYKVEEAVRHARIPTRNVNAATTAFFKAFEPLVAEVAPGLFISRKSSRMERSRTAHFISKSVDVHPGLPIPSIFLQFGEGRVRLLVRGWGRYIADLKAAGLHEKHGLTLELISPTAWTLGITAPSPTINTRKDFKSQYDACVAAILATQRLCRWWDRNPHIISAWGEIVTRLAKKR